MNCPKLRAVEAIPLKAQGKPVIALRDPLAIAPDLVALPVELFFLLSLFDGRTSYTDAQAAYVKQHGTLLYTGQIEQLVRQLDENFLLDNERFRERLKVVKDGFRSLPVRPAVCTPAVYSADPDECASQFEDFLDPARRQLAAGADGLVAMVAPHIDIPRGKAVYASAYALLEKLRNVEVFIIFGTSHSMMQNLFALTEKDWITPFGRIRADRRIIRRIKARSESDFLEDEFAHKAEHSIEIQVAMLSYLYRETRNFSIVPILCGGFDALMAAGKGPADDAQFRDFASTLDEALAGDDRPRVFLAGADLAHIGPRFGDEGALSAPVLEEVKRADKESLVHLAAGDAEAFYESVARDQNRRRVCGLSAIYAMLRAARPKTGRILGYEQWVEEGGASSVSFASVALYG